VTDERIYLLPDDEANIRADHVLGVALCRECEELWPCATARLLAALDLARAERDKAERYIWESGLAGYIA
jgi:hypothetical protein